MELILPGGGEGDGGAPTRPRVEVYEPGADPAYRLLASQYKQISRERDDLAWKVADQAAQLVELAAGRCPCPACRKHVHELAVATGRLQLGEAHGPRPTAHGPDSVAAGGERAFLMRRGNQ